MQQTFQAYDFSIGAVRQISERGYSVAEVSARLGVRRIAYTNGSALLRQIDQFSKPMT